MPTEQYEVYAEFGITSEKAQTLELEAGTFVLSFLAIFVNLKAITPEITEMFRAVNDDLNRKTLGALLNRIKKYVNLDDSIIRKVDEALERRNYLTHHFFRSHNFAIYGEEGRKTMMAELKEIQTTLDMARDTLSAMTQINYHCRDRNGYKSDRGTYRAREETKHLARCRVPQVSRLSPGAR